MELSRTKKAKYNIFFSLLQQGITLICGLIVPKMLLGAFGSVACGATASITTFLAYIVLLEGGIGAVSRSTLYKALAEGSRERISQIVAETKSFFRKLGYIYIIYVLILAVCFKEISHNTTFSFWYTFGLVIIISLSTFAEYFIGISYSLLLQADQLDFIQSASRIMVTILNTAAVVALVKMGCDLLIVKLASSAVFVLRPILLAVFVKKKYRLLPGHSGAEPAIKQKWTAVGQHIAWTLHNNTDIVVLTIFQSLSLVSVYSIYNMIVNQIQNLTTAFSSGMEAVFGDMLAKNELNKLQKTFSYYETTISLFGVTLFSVTASLIIPFVKIYTSNVHDVEYIYPTFAVMLTLSSLLYCLRSPYHNMITAAGQFKQTRLAAYGECVINIGLSIALVFRLGLLGVAIGTVAATAFRLCYYVIYLSKNIFYRRSVMFLKRLAVNSISFGLVFIPANVVISKIPMDDYFDFIIAGLLVSAFAGMVVFIFNYVFYSRDIKEIIKRGFGKK